MSIRIGLIVLCMNNEVDLEHWPISFLAGQERYRERGWVGGHLKNTYKLCPATNRPPPSPQIPQSLTPFLWENTLRTLVLTVFEKSLGTGHYLSPGEGVGGFWAKHDEI